MLARLAGRCLRPLTCLHRAAAAAPIAALSPFRRQLSSFDHDRVVDMFRDPYEADRSLPPPGRRWRAEEIRLKSNEDLQKLWVLLLKERNMLHTTKLLHQKRKSTMPYPERLPKVRKSMAMIKVVLGERYRERELKREEASRLTELEHLAAQEDHAANSPEPSS